MQHSTYENRNSCDSVLNYINHTLLMQSINTNHISHRAIEGSHPQYTGLHSGFKDQVSAKEMLINSVKFRYHSLSSNKSPNKVRKRPKFSFRCIFFIVRQWSRPLIFCWPLPPSSLVIKQTHSSLIRRKYSWSCGYEKKNKSFATYDYVQGFWSTGNKYEHKC